MHSTFHRPALDPATIQWDRVETGTYVVHQRFRYEYPARILDLEHQLVVIPAMTFGDQSRTVYSVEVSEAGEIITRTDAFANTVLDVWIPRVDQAIQFDAWVTLERTGPAGPRSVPAAWLRDPRFLEPTPRTLTDEAIERAAADLLASGAQGLALAELANRWVFDTMTYTPGVTGIGTTASAALAARQGVCQDYSHLMLAICRRMGIPALYVSGHLLGEGATHAWVEVVLPAAEGAAGAEAWALDPTHGRHANLTYLTVAVGRDYADVAPTSGSYRAGHGGTLTAHKDVRVVEVVYGGQPA
ncbi:MAG: transglutaminase family protein [Chloroflexi bacterium]|nr:transglutaminase family protein [Chloroflexota bacterium]